VRYAPLLLEVSPAPMQSVSGWTIIVLLAVILFLSVAFAGGLVIFLIRFKRKKQRAE
jgi:heme/copper-type cytochrome/quinol oxidase subunit 2